MTGYGETDYLNDNKCNKCGGDGERTETRITTDDQNNVIQVEVTEDCTRCGGTGYKQDLDRWL